MELKPKVSRITIYPIKSLDGLSLQSGLIIKGGSILHDREYAIVDSNGNFIIGKTNPLVHALRSTIDFEKEIVSFRHHENSEWDKFDLQNEKSAIDAYLSAFFKIPVTLHQNKEGRFMDIPDISGITILSTESLKAVAAWFDNIDLEETRKRFRATIELEGADPFWEDHLFSKEGTGIEFTLGEVTLFGMSPRARCVVPSRDPETGEVIHAFPKIFSRHRAATLPHWSKLNEHGHSYYLTVNCYIPATEIGKAIQIGDEVNIIGEKVFY
ncbi:MAG: MOSC domain-containing protein [Niastella sp.]|uniref:MOSC domain-containing protein n=1 Tax=Niastella sp. TaxID=1869183 RepID=UPI003899918B